LPLAPDREPLVEDDRLRDDDDPDDDPEELLDDVERGLFVPRDCCRRRERFDGDGERLRLRESERDTEDDGLLLEFLLGLECLDDFETDFEGGDLLVVDSLLEGLCLDPSPPRLSLVFVVPPSSFLMLPSPPSFLLGLAFFFVSFFALLFSILRLRLRLRLFDSLFRSDCFLFPPLLLFRSESFLERRCVVLLSEERLLYDDDDLEERLL
jgi:hypothetical protein